MDYLSGYILLWNQWDLEPGNHEDGSSPGDDENCDLLDPFIVVA